MANSDMDRKFDLQVIYISFTALQTYVNTKRGLRKFLKKITGGLVDKESIELQVSDCFRGGHRDGVRFMTTNLKQHDKALKFLTKLHGKKGCLSVSSSPCPAKHHPNHSEGDKFASLSINY